MAECFRSVNNGAIKYLCIPLLLRFLLSCAPSPVIEQEPPLQETKFYDHFTFEAVWAAALLAIDDIEFAVQKEIKDSGFIYAQAKNNPDSPFLPPHLNVYVRDENGRIRVSCHAVIPGQEADLHTSSGIVKRFFSALAVHLMQ